MKAKSVITLWAVALVLLSGVLVVKSQQANSSHSKSVLNEGDKLWDSSMLEKVEEIKISAGDQTNHMRKSEGVWVSENKDGFPIDKGILFDRVVSLLDAEVRHSLRTSERYFPRFGLNEGSENLVKLELLDGSGETLDVVFLGDTIKSEEQSQFGTSSLEVGRRVRVASDPNGVYSLSHVFPSIDEPAEDWLEAEFASLNKVKSISKKIAVETKPLYQRTAEDYSIASARESLALEAMDNWVVKRESVEEDFRPMLFPDGFSQKTSAFKQFERALANASYESLLGKESLDEWLKDKSDHEVTEVNVKTFDDVSYRLQFTKENPKDEKSAYILSYEIVNGNDKRSDFLYRVSENILRPLLLTAEDLYEQQLDPS